MIRNLSTIKLYKNKTKQNKAKNCYDILIYRIVHFIFPPLQLQLCLIQLLYNIILIIRCKHA